jgi:hypothetical protein
MRGPQAVSVDLDFSKHPTLYAFHASAAYLRAVVGPAGTGKTTFAFKDLLVRSMLQSPGKGGVRKTRWVVVRNTNYQLRENTLPSFRMAMGSLLKPTDTTMYPKIVTVMSFPLPDGTSVQIEWRFIGMDSESALNDILGGDVTGGLLDEVSLLSLEVVQGLARRSGRYPSNDDGKADWSGVIMATNGPLKNHWLYKWKLAREPGWDQWEEETERATGIARPYFELFEQPPALLRPEKPGGKWLPNPRAENIHNLSEGYLYYYKMLADSEDKIQAYVEGVFCDLKQGKVVFPEFHTRIHVLPAGKIEVGDGAPLYLGFDFGSTPVCVIATTTRTGKLVILDEVCAEHASADSLFLHKLKPLLATKYRRCQVHVAWGDPAGLTLSQATDLTPFGVLESHGLNMQLPNGKNNTLTPRLYAVRKRLTQLDEDGFPMLQITDNCTIAIDAINHNYVYESTGKTDDAFREVPTKSHANWVSDIMDAIQYLCLGYDNMFAVRRDEDDQPQTSTTRRHLVRRRR